MFAAPVLIDRSMTNFSAWIGGNGNRIKSKMAARYREKRTSITTVWDQYLSSATFPTPSFFITHYLKVAYGIQAVLWSGIFLIRIWLSFWCDLGPGPDLFCWLCAYFINSELVRCKFSKNYAIFISDKSEMIQTRPDPDPQVYGTGMHTTAQVLLVRHSCRQSCESRRQTFWSISGPRFS